MVSAEEIGRSLRGTAALVRREPDALAVFELGPHSLRRSFGAFLVTIPVWVVTVALARRGMGLSIEGLALFEDAGLLGAVGLAHFASLAALQAAMAWVMAGGPFAPRYVAFAVATNWIAVFGSLALAAPAALDLMGIEPPGFASVLMLAFAVVAVQAQWFATQVTLRVGPALASAVTGLGLCLQIVVYGLLRAALSSAGVP